MLSTRNDLQAKQDHDKTVRLELRFANHGHFGANGDSRVRLQPPHHAIRQPSAASVRFVHAIGMRFQIAASMICGLNTLRPYPTTLTGQRMDDVFAAQLAVGSGGISAHRRSAVANVRQSLEPDCISGELWRRMGISMLSLPAHLRPGKHGR